MEALKINEDIFSSVVAFAATPKLARNFACDRARSRGQRKREDMTTDLGDDVVGDGEVRAAVLAAVDVAVHVVELEGTGVGVVRVDGAEAVGHLGDGVHGRRSRVLLGCFYPFFGANHLR
jgi:hypothetical protein